MDYLVPEKSRKATEKSVIEMYGRTEIYKSENVWFPCSMTFKEHIIRADYIRNSDKI